MSSAPKVSAKTNSGLVDDHDPNDLGQKLVNKETLSQGYDAQRGGTTSGKMDEHQHLHDVKDGLPKGDVQYKPGEKSDPKNPKPEE